MRGRIAKGCSREIRGAVAAVITSAAAAAASRSITAAARPNALTYNGGKVGQLRGALRLAFAGA